MSRDLIRFMQSLFVPALQEHCAPAWCPAADVYRTPDGWLLKLDVAGVDAEDIRVAICGQRLTVSGQRRDTSRGQGWRCHHMEIAYSRFERDFELPWDLRHCGITTEYCAGMLHINIRTETEK